MGGRGEQARRQICSPPPLVPPVTLRPRVYWPWGDGPSASYHTASDIRGLHLGARCLAHAHRIRQHSIGRSPIYPAQLPRPAHSTPHVRTNAPRSSCSQTIICPKEETMPIWMNLVLTVIGEQFTYMDDVVRLGAGCIGPQSGSCVCAYDACRYACMHTHI